MFKIHVEHGILFDKSKTDAAIPPHVDPAKIDHRCRDIIGDTSAYKEGFWKNMRVLCGITRDGVVLGFGGSLSLEKFGLRLRSPHSHTPYSRLINTSMASTTVSNICLNETEPPSASEQETHMMVFGTKVECHELLEKIESSVASGLSVDPEQIGLAYVRVGYLMIELGIESVEAFMKRSHHMDRYSRDRDD